MILQDIYEIESAALRVLYELLKERTPEQSISHEKMPTWEEHVAYIAKRPVEHWYLIGTELEWVGSIYLSRRREIGISVLREQQHKGYGTWAVRELMSLYPGKFYANVAPENFDSQDFFNKLGFKVIQETYLKGT